MIATVPIQPTMQLVPDSTPEFNVGDLLGVEDGYLATVESVDEDGYTLTLSNGKSLDGTAENLIRWGYRKLWSLGDRVTPKHRPGSRNGTIVGFNVKNKKTPVLVKFDGGTAENKWGKDALVPVDEPNPDIVIDDRVKLKTTGAIGWVEAIAGDRVNVLFDDGEQVTPCRLIHLERVISLGDRVRGVSPRGGKPKEGIVTAIGGKYFQLDNSRGSIVQEAAELLQVRAVPSDLIDLVGKSPYELADDLLSRDFAFADRSLYPALQPISPESLKGDEVYRGWKIAIDWRDEKHTSIDGADIAKPGVGIWTKAIKEQLSESELMALCKQAIDAVEDARVRLGLASEDESAVSVDGFKVGDRVRVIKGTANGLVSHITAIEPGLKHCIKLHVGGRQRPDCLEKLEASISEPVEQELSEPKAEETVAPSEEFKPAAQYNEGEWVTGFTLSQTEATGRFVGYSLSGMLRVDCSTSSDPNSSCVKMIDPATAKLIDPPESSLTAVENSDLVIDPRTQLVDEINQLSGQLEEAQEVAESADRSALQFAKEIGDRLLALKPQVEHGEWEAFREVNIKSPRTGKPMASSTATLCQRVAKRWGELQEQGIESLKQASLTLRKTQQIEEAKSATVADLPEAELEPAATIEQPDIDLAEVERRGELIGDLVPPTWGELKSLYSQLGKVSDWKNGIAVESERYNFTATFQTREEAWEKWQRKYKPALDRQNQQTGQTTGQESPKTSPLNDYGDADTDSWTDENGITHIDPIGAFYREGEADAQKYEREKALANAQTGQKADRVEHDYYPTPEPLTEALIEIVEIKGQVFDCCDGTSSISKFFHGAITNEPYPQEGCQPDYQGDASDEALWEQVEAEGGTDWTVSNPPYGLELPVKILALAVKYSRVGVSMLLRISFLEPCKERAAWMIKNSDQLRYVIPVNPRPQFRADIKGGDSFTVAWFVWIKDWSWKALGIDCPFQFITDWKKQHQLDAEGNPLHVVPPDEGSRNQTVEVESVVVD